jgi:RNA polymerase sigma-70 factor (ECF subfamily)
MTELWTCRGVSVNNGRGDLQREVFASFFREVFVDLVRFCARRVEETLAEDLAAEAMTVAWRRVDELPPDHGGRRAWVFTIARNLMLNSARDLNRRRVLAVRLAQETNLDTPGADVLAEARTDLTRAWRLLSDRHREALALSVWDGLTSQQAATVLGISAVAYRLRLARARAALHAHLGVHPPPERPYAHTPKTAAWEAQS